MIVFPYNKEELLKLRDRVNSARSLNPPDAVALNKLQLSLQRVDDPDYNAGVLIDDMINGGESEFIDNKYTLVARVFQMPLEKMPLLLNHVTTGIQTIAMWRLDIAK
jgi:hypothetical protein